MAVILNHAIVPSRDKEAAARWFAEMFGLDYDGAMHGFAAVRVNDTLTLLFDDAEAVARQHYAFHVSEAEFDAILERVRAAGLSYGSAPSTPDDAGSTPGAADAASTSATPTPSAGANDVPQ
jgi:hypothetical protein